VHTEAVGVAALKVIARGVAVWLHHDVELVQQSYATLLEYHRRAVTCVESHLTGDAAPHLHGQLAQRSDLLRHLADVAVILPPLGRRHRQVLLGDGAYGGEGGREVERRLRGDGDCADDSCEHVRILSHARAAGFRVLGRGRLFRKPRIEYKSAKRVREGVQVAFYSLLASRLRAPHRRWIWLRGYPLYISQLSHTRKIVVTARVGDALASEPLKVTYVRVFMCSRVSYAIYAEKQPDTHSLWALSLAGLSC
jgi:hypothetical protein